MRYALSPPVMMQQSGDTLVLLDTEAGQYFELNDTGRVWLASLLASQSEGEAMDAVLEAFDVERETARADLDSLKAALLSAGLLAVT